MLHLFTVGSFLIAYPFICDNVNIYITTCAILNSEINRIRIEKNIYEEDKVYTQEILEEAIINTKNKIEEDNFKELCLMMPQIRGRLAVSKLGIM